jgi:deoxyadenosine/deoxycytidine kinase
MSMSAWAKEPVYKENSEITLTIYFVEANVGAGKSELLKGLENVGYTCVPEPLEVWQKEYLSENGNNILQEFYNDPKGMSFPFQMVVIMTRYRLIMKTIEEAERKGRLTGQNQIVIMERSLFTDRNCFSQLLYEENKISELQWKIYCEWHNFFMKHTVNLFFGQNTFVSNTFSKIDTKYLFLNTDPEICYSRIKGRARKEEDTVPFDYIKKLHTKHVSWLLNNSIEIDGNKDRSEVLEQVIYKIQN